MSKLTFPVWAKAYEIEKRTVLYARLKRPLKRRHFSKDVEKTPFLNIWQGH
ncbi:MAG: hypothetical protein SPL38_10315 [Fibrobacter sp.]|nr:hypothetical protein [Fibrobacter sp.]